MQVKELSEPGLFQVSSERNEEKFYTLDLNERNCSCPSFRYKGPCKHLRYLETYLEMETDRALAEVY